MLWLFELRFSEISYFRRQFLWLYAKFKQHDILSFYIQPLIGSHVVRSILSLIALASSWIASGKWALFPGGAVGGAKMSILSEENKGWRRKTPSLQPNSFLPKHCMLRWNPTWWSARSLESRRNYLADSCVSSDLVPWESTERLANWGDLSHTAGFSKVHPVGQVRPTKTFYPARKDTLSIMKK